MTDTHYVWVERAQLKEEALRLIEGLGEIPTQQKFETLCLRQEEPNKLTNRQYFVLQLAIGFCL